MNIILSIAKTNNSLITSAIVKNIVTRVLLLLTGCMIFLFGKSQKDNRLEVADKYFAAGDYFTAAGLYEQILNPVRPQETYGDFPLNAKKNRFARTPKQLNKLDILYKQSESYRLANYWPKASEGYKKCFENDIEKYEAGLYWYAVCQRSIGSYNDAEESVNRFLSSSDKSNPFHEEAQKELERIQFIKNQLARPDSILYRVQKLNTSFGNEKGVFAAIATSDNHFLLTSAKADPVVKTGINPFYNRLFTSTFINDSLQSIEPLAIEGADPSLNQGTASISSDGNYLYFTQWKKENGQTISSIYYSTKKQEGWSVPVLLSSVNEESYSSKQPFCSADGKYLFYSSDRPGGSGKFDIWYAPIQADGSTGEPVNAGAVLNSAANEQSPFYHNISETLVFASDREPGMGGYDLFESQGKETEWKTPENMGHPVNSSRDDLYFFGSQKEILFGKAILSSDRGSECCLETYTISKTPKKQMISGIIRDCRDNEPLADAVVVLKDESGKSVQVTTGSNGVYEFELLKDVKQYQLYINKDLYKEKPADIMIANSNGSDWLIHTHYNEEICLEKKLVIKAENVVTVYFDFDKSLLKERGISQLDSIYNVLMEDTVATIQISGYTDGLGSVEYNKVLSDKRAKACADYLISKGIDTSRISFESFGACCPIEMELINGRDNPDGRSMNRRALINITKE